MTTRRGKEAWDRMTPEKRAAVEAIRAKHRTPEAQAENARAAAEAEQVHPRIAADEVLLQFVAGLRLERERAGLSLADVAARTGLDRATVHRIESGKVPNPTYSTLKAYAAALGCRVGLVLERSPAEVES